MSADKYDFTSLNGNAHDHELKYRFSCMYVLKLMKVLVKLHNFCAL